MVVGGGILQQEREDAEEALGPGRCCRRTCGGRQGSWRVWREGGGGDGDAGSGDAPAEGRCGSCRALRGRRRGRERRGRRGALWWAVELREELEAPRADGTGGGHRAIPSPTLPAGRRVASSHLSRLFPNFQVREK